MVWFCHGANYTVEYCFSRKVCVEHIIIKGQILRSMYTLGDMLDPYNHISQLHTRPASLRIRLSQI